MKNIKIIIPVFLFILLMGMGCNNNTNTDDDTNTVTEDTTAGKDTIKSDPESFSQPH